MASLNLGGQTTPNAGTNRTTGFVARLGALVLATQLAAPASPGLQAWPTPGPGTGVWVQGAPAGAGATVTASSTVRSYFPRWVDAPLSWVAR